VLAEKADVAADHRPEIEQDRQLARGQGLEELGKGFGRENRVAGLTRRRPLGTSVEIALARREAIQQAHSVRSMKEEGRSQKWKFTFQL
jgi:hypothetical protein